MACSVLITDSQKATLTRQLIDSQFGDDLYDAYQGNGNFPDIVHLVTHLNNKVIPRYFTDYTPNDLVDFYKEARNRTALSSAIGDALFKIEKSRLKTVIDDPDYYGEMGKVIDTLRNDAFAKVASIKQDEVEQVKAAEVVDSSSDGLQPPQEFSSFINQQEYKNIQAYRESKFRGSSATEALLMSKFLNDVLLKNAFIDTSLGKGKGLVSQRQEPGRPAEDGIDNNLKNYRKKLLESMLTRTQLSEEKDGVGTPIKYSESLLDSGSFQGVLDRLYSKITNINYHGEHRSLTEDGLLSEIVNEYRKSGSSELKEVVDNYVDHLILSDFDKLFDYYGQNSIHVNKYNDPFDLSTRKYSTKSVTSVESINAAWKEQIQDGINLSSDLYKTLISVTPQLSIITGQPNGEYLYPTLVSEVFSRYYDQLDFENSHDSIKDVMLKALKDPNNSSRNKDTIYTMYKRFFEEEGDDFPNQPNKEIASFANTLSGYEDESLLRMISMPIEQTPKVFYAEANEVDKQLSIVIANARGNTASRNIIRDEITRRINLKDEALVNLIDNYGIRFDGDSIIFHGRNDGVNEDWTLRPSNNLTYDMAVITDLSKSLLGLDFVNNKAHQEFKDEQQLKAGGKDGQITQQYLTFLYDALKVVQARKDLLDPIVVDEIQTKGVQANVTNVLLKNLIEADKINSSTPQDTIIPLNNANSTSIFDDLYAAQNRYTGNRLRSTVMTLEGTTVAGYSVPTYFLTLKNNHNKIREVMASVKNPDVRMQTLSDNAFIVDNSLLERFHIRGAVKVGPLVKSNSGLNEVETVNYNVSLGYFDLLNKAVKAKTPIQAMFDITTYSDKSTEFLPLINNTFTPKVGNAINLFVDNGVAVHENVTRDLHFDTNASYYRSYANNIVSTWRSIYGAAGAGERFNASGIDRMKPSAKLALLNKMNTEFFQQEGFDHNLKGIQAARYYAGKAGVALNNWVHYQNNAKTLSADTPLIVKPELIDYVKLYDSDDKSAYLKVMHQHMISMANRMLDLGYRLNGPAADGIAQLYPNMPGQFKQPSTGTYLVKATYATRINDINDINPALRKYFWDFNLISENLMNSSLGPIYAHKAKSGKDSEFNMWVTQVKRNVAAGASIRKYSLGMEQGVENSTRVAMVDDLTSSLKTILADKQAVVQFDGAALETYTQRLKTWNSLNAKFNGNGGMDHKPFFSHIDPITGEFHEEKLATFTMDNEMIRQSKGSDVDLYELHKNLYDTDLSKIDITRSWRDSVDLSNFQDHYHWDRKYDYANDTPGHIFKLESIKYTGKDELNNSLYDITRRNMTLDPSTPYTLPNQRINNMFDLWNELGSIDSVTPTSTKTAIAYKDGDETVYFKPSHIASERLLDYESYMGKGGEYILPADKIRRNRSSDITAWNEYSKLFNTDGVVNSHISLLRGVRGMDAGNAEHIGQVQQTLYSHDVKVGAFDFINSANENGKLFDTWFKTLIDPKEKNELKFAIQNKPYQRFKGKNIDRVAYAGAVKVGQFNMNDSSTVSRSKREQFHIDNPTVDHQAIIPGVTHLLTHQISNMNAGIQLNAFHEADEAIVTAPTQMLNALGFRSFALDDVREVYDALGNIVFQGLNYALPDPTTGIVRNTDIPSLISSLGEVGTSMYQNNKEQLLRVFKDLLDKRVSEEDDFTLESLITKSFDHMNIPIDDPHIFSAAVAELTNYFTKSGIRTNFDGIFSTLTPASRMMQFHDVKGGYYAIKTENGLRYKELPTNTTSTLNRGDYEEWKRLQSYALANPAKFQGSDENGESLPFNVGTVVNEIPRDLKGQQVVITYTDGHEQALSILRSGEEHLIPEAEALSKVTTLIDQAKSNVLSTDPYKTSNGADKIAALSTAFENFKTSLDKLASEDPRVKHAYDSFMQAYVDSHSGNLPTTHILDALYNEFSKTKVYRERKNATLSRNGQTNKLVTSHEYEYEEKVNFAGKMFLHQLQDFLHQASYDGNVPLSLKGTLFNPEGGRSLDGAKISISRAECIAPLTAKTAFRMREGDTINDVDEHFFYTRLMEDLDYLDVNADWALVSNYGKKVFVHDGAKPKSVVKSDNVTNVNGQNWYTDDSGNRLFQIPKGVTIANIGGAIHMYNNGKYDMLVDHAIRDSLNKGFRDGGDNGKGEVFRVKQLGGDEAERAQRRADAQVELQQTSREMHASWEVYLDTIGTRIPGQHFQSFQGMKIVGFTEGNKIYTPDEVELLSGSDFDIDKQNVIYYSVNDDGKIATWHPASNMYSADNLRKSLLLPMQSGKGRETFIAERGPQGEFLDKVLQIDDSSNMKDLDTLLHIYSSLKNGFRLDPDTNPNVVQSLVDYEQSPNRGGVKAVKNFAVQKANTIIHTPDNFTLLSKPVTLDTPASFADNSDKAAQARQGRRENPVSKVDQRQSNLVGKKVIGIMAAGGLKTYSAINFTYNSDLKSAERLVDHHEKLSRTLDQLNAQPIKDTGLVNEYSHRVSQTIDDLNERIYKPLGVGKELNALAVRLNNEEVETSANLNYRNLSADTIKSFYRSKGYSEDTDVSTLHPGTLAAFKDVNPTTLKNYLVMKVGMEDDAADLLSQLLSAATDNAKELILNKINATPELAGIYSSLLMFGVPFEEIVDLTNSKTMDFIVSRGVTNVFDSTTSDNSITNLVSTVGRYTDLASRNDLTDSQTKNLRALKTSLATQYGIEVKDGDLVDLSTNHIYPGNEVENISGALSIGEELRTLSASLGINQGVKSNTWDLYAFRKNLENYVTRRTSSSESPNNFILKDFLDSMQNDTGDYKTQIGILNSNIHATNILHVLASNPHFAKQLTAYNAASTILSLSSYKVNVMYKMEEKLRELGVIGRTSKLTKPQFQEVERFIDNTIIENFIHSETRGNRDPNTRPIFYDDHTELTLDDRLTRTKFADWVRDKFLPKVKDMDTLRSNDFIQALSPKERFDKLLNAPYSTVSLDMDTTNVKSIQQRQYRDAYAYNLKQIYDRQLTDGRAGDPVEERNNIFNTLFWYNLLVNKNNITKNSYALLLGEVMKLDDTRDNPYRRLLELKGNIGKSEDLGHTSGRLLASSNGVSFDLLDLLDSYDFGNKQRVGDRASSGYSDDEDAGEEWYDEPEEAMHDDDDDTNSNFDDMEYDDYNEGEETIPGGTLVRAKIDKISTYGETGTRVNIDINNGDFRHSAFISDPYMLIPHGGENRNKQTYISNYKALAPTSTGISDSDVVNYQKVLSMSMHQFLSNLSEDTDVQIIQKSPDGKEIITTFDPTKEYHCL